MGLQKQGEDDGDRDRALYDFLHAAWMGRVDLLGARNRRRAELTYIVSITA